VQVVLISCQFVVDPLLNWKPVKLPAMAERGAWQALTLVHKYMAMLAVAIKL